MMIARMEKRVRRDYLLHSAKTVFSERGYHAASVADIIERAGIARGTFYLYFDGKRQVFERILDDLLDDLDARIAVIKVGSGSPPPLEQLRDNLRRVMTLLHEDPHLVRILLQQAEALDAGGREKLDIFYRKVLDRIEASLRMGTAMGLVRPCQPRVVAACILGAVKEAVAQLVLGPPTEHEIEAVIDQILDFGLHGVLEA